MNILVSACLLGVNCRYNGTGGLREELLKLMTAHSLIPICPEQLAAAHAAPSRRMQERTGNH